MKTSIKTLIATTLTAIVLTTTFSTSVSANETKPVKVSTLSNFKRITVNGNIEVTLIQGNAPSVTYADDNYGTAKVMQEGDHLIISSTNNETTKLTVYVKDIYRIAASENAIVKTEGKLNTQYLQIFLKDAAHAEINTSTESLYTTIDGNADLKLSGATNNHTLVMSKNQNITMDKFAALNTNINNVETSAIDKVIVSK